VEESDAIMSTSEDFPFQGEKVVGLNRPLFLKEKFLDHKIGVLLSFNNILDIALKDFQQVNDSQKKVILSEILKVAFANAVISEKEIQEKLMVEQSTVNRWKNGETLPPKRKQVAVLALVYENVHSEIDSLKVQQEKLRREPEGNTASARQGRP
jgi:transcriptional regulator with XRE-family HTH domain